MFQLKPVNVGEVIGFLTFLALILGLSLWPSTELEGGGLFYGLLVCTYNVSKVYPYSETCL